VEEKQGNDDEKEAKSEIKENADTKGQNDDENKSDDIVDAAHNQENVENEEHEEHEELEQGTKDETEETEVIETVAVENTDLPKEFEGEKEEENEEEVCKTGF
jgi:hypothetical protein